MSNVKIKINHIPSVTEYAISGHELALKYEALGVAMPFPRSDYWYYFTNPEGWAKILHYLVLSSSLYKPDRFDCEDFALKAQTMCAELFGLNTLRYTYGYTPLGPHGFNSLWAYSFILFEPNAKFQETLGCPIFDWGENEYQPTHVLL